jgi:signal transduction histidine kinase
MPSHDSAVRHERERIAQEIHDVLGHHLTVLSIHASATKALPGVPANVQAQLELIRTSAKQALQDLRGILDLLDADGDGSRGETDGTSLNELDGLVKRVSTAGLNVRLTLRESDPALNLEREVSRTAVRIVQEALTNSLKHGRATDSRVAVEYDDDALTVEVIDNGAGAAPSPVLHRRHRGLRGIQARVNRMRGDLQVGPDPAGGFRVWARLPRLVAAERQLA